MKHILFVDDEPLIRQGFVTMLKSYPGGIDSVRTAENGLKALQLIKESLPQIVFTDIRMPKMDGLELCRHISAEYPNIQLVILSGYSDFEYAQAGIAYGVKEYVLKPVTPHKVHHLLDKLVSHSQSAFSISRYEEWIDQLVEAVWALRMDSAAACLAQWQIYCNHAAHSDTDFIRLLDEGLQMVGKRLAQRDFHMRLDSIPPSSNREDAFAMFHIRIEHMVDELALQRGGHDLIKMAKDYIDTNISNELTLEEVAEYVGVTPPYFSHLFKKVCTETFVNYRILKRMELAKRLLEIPHYRTTDIASEVGYENYPHFSKTFKKVTGSSPQEYRHMMGIK